ncbi:MAG TPA: amidohydrolase family protein [Phycisphaerae bacterium]|nr:amidohydrolase family protein [Phycisphaerae bacterium]
MIVDCQTHIWTATEQLGAGAPGRLSRENAQEGLVASPADHAEASQCVDKTLVLGFRSAYLSAEVPNELIAEHVGRHPEAMVGVAAVDPTEPGGLAAAERCLQRDEFRGLTLSPSLQNFHPCDTRAMALYEFASGRGAPVFFSHGPHLPLLGRMDYARPFLLDEVAREFGDLTFVVSALGYPWVAECIALVAKHPRAFADVAALVRRPWIAYNALVQAYQLNVTDKLLFGSDFPYFTPARAIEAVYRMNEMVGGTNLPTVPREVLRSIVERDSLSVLGIARAGESPAPQPIEEEQEQI